MDEDTTAELGKRSEREQRILDVAATLVLRWGYNKTSIDDIARAAGVAKGTIYLHWKTREELFGALVRRERQIMSADFRRAIAENPGHASLHGMIYHSALALLRRPLLKAILLGDAEILGKLVHTEQHSTLYHERIEAFGTYLRLLREHGLARTDLSLTEQIYTLSAIFMGHLQIGPLMPQGFELGDETLAGLIAEAVRRTLEPADLPATAARDAGEALQVYFRQRAASEGEHHG
ncbi:TetR/AcrR family transcriptional regulator [Chloroflexia bacterium SDU3-3]|nr:TetR/AcrR family transcriptional regulator [Chloroflexia bacterium SDU3-3]